MSDKPVDFHNSRINAEQPDSGVIRRLHYRDLGWKVNPSVSCSTLLRRCYTKKICRAWGEVGANAKNRSSEMRVSVALTLPITTPGSELSDETLTTGFAQLKMRQVWGLLAGDNHASPGHRQGAPGDAPDPLNQQVTLDGFDPFVQ